MAYDNHSRFATVSEHDMQFKLVIGHTTKHMAQSRSWDVEALSCDIFNLGSSYFRVPLTTVRRLLNAAFYQKGTKTQLSPSDRAMGRVS